MKDQGASIDIDGMALSTDAVASLICQSAEDRILHQHRNQRDLPGRHLQGNAGIQFHLDLREGEVLGRRKNMANFNELSGIKQWAAALGVAAGSYRGPVLHPVQEPARSQCYGPGRPGHQAPRKRGTGILPAQAGGHRAPVGQPQTAAGDRAQDRSRRERSAGLHEDDGRRGGQGRDRTAALYLQADRWRKTSTPNCPSRWNSMARTTRW